MLGIKMVNIKDMIEIVVELKFDGKRRYTVIQARNVDDSVPTNELAYWETN